MKARQQDSSIGIRWDCKKINRLSRSLAGKLSRYRARRGFSLLELIITVTLLFAIAGARFFALRSQLLGALDGSAEVAVSRLKDAQSLAIAGASNITWGIRFDNTVSSTPAYYLFSGASYATATQRFYFSKGVEYQSPAAGTSTDIVFSKLSGNSSASTTIILRLKSDTARTRTIRISGKGNITLEY